MHAHPSPGGAAFSTVTASSPNPPAQFAYLLPNCNRGWLIPTPHGSFPHRVAGKPMLLQDCWVNGGMRRRMLERLRLSILERFYAPQFRQIYSTSCRWQVVVHGIVPQQQGVWVRIAIRPFFPWVSLCNVRSSPDVAGGPVDTSPVCLRIVFWQSGPPRRLSGYYGSPQGSVNCI